MISASRGVDMLSVVRRNAPGRTRHCTCTPPAAARAALRLPAAGEFGRSAFRAKLDLDEILTTKREHGGMIMTVEEARRSALAGNSSWPMCGLATLWSSQS